MDKKKLFNYYLISFIPTYTGFYILLHDVLSTGILISYVLSCVLGATLNLILYKKLKVINGETNSTGRLSITS